MTNTDVLNMLFGAALVAIGVLAAALADRIRGIRFGYDRAIAPRKMMPPMATVASARGAVPIEVIEPERACAVRAESKTRKMQTMADDVIAALMAAGYKKPIAAEAAWGCSQAERVTIEHWTRAALRRCAKGATS